MGALNSHPVSQPAVQPGPLWPRNNPAVPSALGLRRPREPRCQPGLVQQSQDCLGQSLGLVHGNEEPGALVLHHVRDAAGRGRDHRDAGGEGLDDSVGLVVNAGAVDEDPPPCERRRHLPMGDPAVKPDPWRPQRSGEAPQARLGRPDAVHVAFRVRHPGADERERAQRVVDRVHRLEQPRRNQARAQRHRIAEAERRGVDDVADDERLEPVAREHPLQERRRHHERGCPGHRPPQHPR